MISLGIRQPELEEAGAEVLGIPHSRPFRLSDLVAPGTLLAQARAQRLDAVAITSSVPTQQVGFSLFYAWLLAARPRRIMTPSATDRWESRRLAGFLAATLPAAALQLAGGVLTLAIHWGATRVLSRRRPLPGIVNRPASVLYLRVASGYMANFGGSLTHAFEVIRGLRGAGIRVVPCAAVLGASETPELGLPLEVPAAARLLPGTVAMGGDLVLVRRSLAEARRSDAIYQRATSCSVAGLLLASLARRPLILEHNSGTAQNGVLRGLGRYEVWLESLNLRFASRIVVVSDVLRDHLVNDGVDPDRILVNPNGVDPSRFRGRGTEERDALALSSSEVVFGFVGTFAFWHGAPVLARAFVGVAAVRPTARLLLVGDGDELAETVRIIEEAGLEERVISLGRVEPDRVPQLLEACDVLCSPHVPWPDGRPFHGSPTKLFEYMASGRAIVASELGQIADVLDHEQTALLVPPANVEALQAAMLRLCDDRELRARLGTDGAARAAERHTWRAHVERLVAPAA